jgi:hypothetical protein
MIELSAIYSYFIITYPSQQCERLDANLKQALDQNRIRVMARSLIATSQMAFHVVGASLPSKVSLRGIASPASASVAGRSNLLRIVFGDLRS